jgi:hypothetical protein
LYLRKRKQKRNGIYYTIRNVITCILHPILFGGCDEIDGIYRSHGRRGIEMLIKLLLGKPQAKRSLVTLKQNWAENNT